MSSAFMSPPSLAAREPTSDSSYRLVWGLPLVLCGMWLVMDAWFLAENGLREKTALILADRGHGKGWPRDLQWDGADVPHRIQWVMWRTMFPNYLLILFDGLGIAICLSVGHRLRRWILLAIYLAIWAAMAFAVVKASHLRTAIGTGHLIGMALLKTPWVYFVFASLGDIANHEQRTKSAESSGGC